MPIGESLAYDKLVVATGTVYDYFGHDDWENYAPSLETIESALTIRQRLLAAYEAAELEPDTVQQRAWMTFAIVGWRADRGGIGRCHWRACRSHPARENFRNINPADTKILLIEALDQLLTGFTRLICPARQSTR